MDETVGNASLDLFDGDGGGASALVSLGGHDLVVVGAKVLQTIVSPTTSFQSIGGDIPSRETSKR